MRVIVTGSRTWSGPVGTVLLRQVLDALADLAGWAKQELTIVHGACPTGADALAAEWARDMQYHQLPFPADWEQYGKAAGFIRNGAMAISGADLCVAFLRANSSGTLDMIGKARRNGIATLVIPWQDDQEPVPVVYDLPISVVAEYGDRSIVENDPGGLLAA